MTTEDERTELPMPIGELPPLPEVTLTQFLSMTDAQIYAWAESCMKAGYDGEALTEHIMQKIAERLERSGPEDFDNNLKAGLAMVERVISAVAGDEAGRAWVQKVACDDYDFIERWEGNKNHPRATLIHGAMEAARRQMRLAEENPYSSADQLRIAIRSYLQCHERFEAEWNKRRGKRYEAERVKSPALFDEILAEQNEKGKPIKRSTVVSEVHRRLQGDKTFARNTVKEWLKHHRPEVE